MSVKTVVLLDSSGVEVARYDVAAPPSAVPDTPRTIPATLEWYRDAAKWLVTATAATLVLGLGYFGETTEAVLKGMFTGAGVVLGIALIAGTLCYFWVLEYARTWDDLSNIDPTDTTALKQNSDDLDSYAARSGWAYYVMLGAFVMGVGVFAVTCGTRMWRAKSKESYTVTSHNNKLMLTDVATGETFTSCVDPKTRQLMWVRSVAPRKQ